LYLVFITNILILTCWFIFTSFSLPGLPGSRFFVHPSVTKDPGIMVSTTFQFTIINLLSYLNVWISSLINYSTIKKGISINCPWKTWNWFIISSSSKNFSYICSRFSKFYWYFTNKKFLFNRIFSRWSIRFGK